MNQPFGFASGDDKNFDMNSLGAMLQQLGAMMQQAGDESDTGAVSWKSIKDSARQTIAKDGDASITDGQKSAVVDAVELAQTWTDTQTVFPVTTSGAKAWSRSEWVEQTLSAWEPLINPVAEGLQRTMAQTAPQLGGELPAEMAQMIEPVMAMAKKLASLQTSMQIGNGLGALSGDLLAASDIAAPLSPNSVPALLPNAIQKFAADYSLPVNEVMVYVAIREVAFQRLMSANLWLQHELANLIASYARGIEFDAERVQEVLSGIDPNNPESMQEVMSAGIFEPTRTEAQERALAKMEFVLALVEGWVAQVTAAAANQRLTSANALNETFLRRQMSGGPAAKTFTNLVGLELRPKLLRSAINFWSVVESEVGIDKRDGVWSHPDLLPSPEDFENVAAYLAGLKADNRDTFPS
ncbi:MAG: hypothetical protein RL038_461 [Actinomycetota bacterium]